MENKKMTKKEMFNEIRKVVVDNAEMVAFIDHELELLDRKKSSTSLSQTQKDNLELVETIYNELVRIGKAITITDLQNESEILKDYSNQKLSALLKKLVDTNQVAKVIDKKKSYFSIAD